MKKHNKTQKSFCKGFICRKSQRKRCVSCGLYVCESCSFHNNNKERYCIDCGIMKFILNEEYLKDFFECVLK